MHQGEAGCLGQDVPCLPAFERPGLPFDLNQLFLPPGAKME